MEETDNQQQEQSRRDALVRGEAFGEMVRSKGWEFVKKYFETRVRELATELLVTEKPIVEYEKVRMELVGIRKLFAFVDGDIKTLENEQKKNTGAAKKQ